MRRAGWVAVGLAVAVVGAADAAVLVRDRSPRGPIKALSRWSNFPVDASPRPVVLLEPAVRHATFDGHGGLAAYAGGDWVLPALVPAEAQAVAELREAAEDVDLFGAEAQGQADVTTVRAATRELRTDRGKRPLPVFVVSFRGAKTPAVVVAPAAGVFRDVVPAGGALVEVAADGRTVSVREQWGGCRRDPRLEPVETRTAVLLLVRTTSPPVQEDGAMACPDDLAHSVLTATLQAPVGDRVVLTGDGAPAEVTTAQLPPFGRPPRR